jgi:diacylglycerol kinase (ATP)
MMVVVANAKKFGGGFAIAPQASLDDGHLDVVTFADRGFFARLKAMVALMKGVHNDLPGIATTRARRAIFGFASPPSFETDGEWRQAKGTSLVIETLPRALAVLAP